MNLLALTVPEPFAGEALLRFFGRHAVPGVETYREGGDEQGGWIDYRRTLRLPHGPALLRLTWSGVLGSELEVSDPRDLDAGRRRVEQLCDLTRDPLPVADHLRRDERLRPLVDGAPGLRVPGVADLEEHLFRTVIGQQISLAGAANCAGKLVARFGAPHPWPGGAGPTHLFPTAAALAGADPVTLPMPRARGRAVVELAEALAGGSLVLDDDPATLRTRLLARRGIGPWTADYVLMRGLHEPDLLLTSDLAIKRELTQRGITDHARWSPWRSYATMHLWRAYTG